MRPFSLSLCLTLPPILALAALPGRGAPQSQVFQGTTVVTAWPPDLGGAGPFGRGAAGELDGDRAGDLVVLDGSRPVVLWGADEFFAPSPLPFAANDLEVVPGAGPGGRDAIALVDAAGLHFSWFDPSAWAFASQAWNTTSWAGARAVRTADLDASGTADVVGLAADGTTFLTARSRASSPGTFLAGPSFQVQNEALAFVVLQWDGDPALEVAVLSGWGVEVYDMDGSPLQAWPSVLPGGVIASIGQSGTSLERLVWITTYAPPAEQWLMVLAPGGVDDLVDLGELDAVAMVGSDLDLDGFEDILISHRYNHDLLWLRNQRSAANPSGATFIADPEAIAVFDAGPDDDAPANHAWPMVGDLDGDGDPDVGFLVESTSELRVFRGDRIAEDDQRATVSSASYVLPEGASEGVLTLQLQPPAFLPQPATHVEIDVWHQPSYGADLTQDAVSRQLVPLTGWPLTATVPIPEPEIGFERIYHVQIRLSELDAAGAVLWSAPANDMAFTTDLATADLLAAEQGAGEPLQVNGTWPAGAVLGGRLTYLPRMQPYPNGVPPKPKDA